MKFVFRAAFWLGVVLLLLPSPASRTAAPDRLPSASQGLAAKAASADTRQRCPRRLEACADGLQAIADFCLNVYQFLAERGEQRGNRSSRDAVKPSQDTLTPTDLAARWRGSASRKEAVAKRSI
jgi:hypothetical protein